MARHRGSRDETAYDDVARRFVRDGRVYFRVARSERPVLCCGDTAPAGGHSTSDFSGVRTARNFTQWFDDVPDRLDFNCDRRCPRSRANKNRHAPRRMAVALRSYRGVRGWRRIAGICVGGQARFFREESSGRIGPQREFLLAARLDCFRARWIRTTSWERGTGSKILRWRRLPWTTKATGRTGRFSRVPRKQPMADKFPRIISRSPIPASAATQTFTRNGKVRRTIFLPSTMLGIARASSTCRTPSE